VLYHLSHAPNLLPHFSFVIFQISSHILCQCWPGTGISLLYASDIARIAGVHPPHQTSWWRRESNYHFALAFLESQSWYLLLSSWEDRYVPCGCFAL
jgi:hypothetical protein